MSLADRSGSGGIVTSIVEMVGRGVGGGAKVPTPTSRPEGGAPMFQLSRNTLTDGARLPGADVFGA